MRSILAAGLAVAVALGATCVVEAAQPPGKPAPGAVHRPAHPHAHAPRLPVQNIVVLPSNWLPYTYPRLYPSYYDPYYSSYSPYYYGYTPYYYSPPPVFLPAGALYGPGPIMDMMGVSNWNAPRTAGGSAPLAAERPAPRVVARPAANLQKAKPDEADAAAAAGRYIDVGDAQFAKQKYAEAYDRYRRAIRTSPQLPYAWFRQGLALAGMGQYDMAAASLRRGLELQPDWPKSDFRLTALFGGDAAAKNAYLEALAAAAEARPTNADLLFLLGVCQHFDGQPQRAATFLKRAHDLAPGDKAHVQAFLD